MIGDTEISDLVEISNALNKHFTDIGPKLAARIPSNVNMIIFNILKMNMNYVK